MNNTQKNPYRMIGTIFAAIALVELIVVLVLLVFRSPTTSLVALPFAVQSLVFGIVGACFLIHFHRKKAIRERLVANGYRETATVAAIEQNPFVRVNRRHPWHVICHIQRDGVVHEYRSDGYYHLPCVNVGDPIPVYLDRQNEKNYFVDVDSIMPVVIRH